MTDEKHFDAIKMISQWTKGRIPYNFFSFEKKGLCVSLNLEYKKSWVAQPSSVTPVSTF